MIDASIKKRTFAWQPLTPRGVAAFADAPLGRLLVVEFVFSLIAAASVIWFLHQAWYPTINEAIRKLPTAGEIRAGKLDWQGESPTRLAEGHFLGLTVDLKHEGQVRSSAHLAVELGQTDFKVYSILGFLKANYPRGWSVGFNHTELEPWWGAWRPAILGIVAAVVSVALMGCWALLATAYYFPAWLMGFYADRDLTLKGAWKLAGAALMPGALFLSMSIVIYGLGALDLVKLAAAMAVHFIMGWVYVLISPLSHRPSPAALPKNPFVPATEASTRSTPPSKVS
jgi:hypothetical protein